MLPRLGLSTSAMSYENKIDKTESVDSVTSFGHHSDAIVLNFVYTQIGPEVLYHYSFTSFISIVILLLLFLLL